MHKLNKLLGTGTFGNVYLADNYKYAIKSYPLDKNNFISAVSLREICCLINLQHPNICKIYSVYIDENSINIVMELLNENLVNHIENLSNDSKKHQLILQLIDAINYIHSLNYIHGDLSFSNIMVKNDLIKLIDFSASTRAHRHNIGKPTLYVSPPETLIKGQNCTADTWMLACVMYYILIQKPLFCSLTEEMHKNNILQTIQHPSKHFLDKYFEFNDETIVPNNYLEEIKQYDEFKLIKKMLQLNPDKRIKPIEIINDICVKNIAKKESFDFVNDADISQKLKSYNTTVLSFDIKKKIIEIVRKLQIHNSAELIIHIILNSVRFLSVNNKINISLLIVSIIGLSIKLLTEFDVECQFLVSIASDHLNSKVDSSQIKHTMETICITLNWNLDIYTTHDYMQQVPDNYKDLYCYVESILILLPLNVSEQSKIITIYNILKLDITDIIKVHTNVKIKTEIINILLLLRGIALDQQNSVNIFIRTKLSESLFVWFSNVNFSKLINSI